MGSRLYARNFLNGNKLPLAMAVCCAGWLSSAQAYTFTEGATDAGNTLATADSTNPTSSPGMLSAIYGTLQSSSNPGTDADLYAFTVSLVVNLTVTSNNSVTNTAFGGLPLDTALFLFDGSGNALVANDNANGALVTSTLTASLPAGTYYLGISIAGNEPVNSVGQLLFAQNDDSTALRGAQISNNLNPTALSTFDLDNYDDEQGSYAINFTYSSVPEPSTWVAMALGGIVVVSLRLR